jgi:hypothetical protein
MTPHSVRNSAAARKEKIAILQPELHGAATPAPIPPEPEPPPPALPLPKPEPPRAPSTPQPKTNRWSGFLFVADESPEAFNEFYEHLDDHYMPFNEEERISVAKLAEARWALRRRKCVAESIEAGLYAATPDTAKWTEADFKRLAMADFYRLRAEQFAQRAQENVDAFVRQRNEDFPQTDAKQAAA